MIPEDSLTAEQRAALSNTICGDAQAARELEQMGLVTIEDIEPDGDRMIAFFDLTEAGEAFVDRHYVVASGPDSHGASETSDDA
jgi:hypothetical protein